MSGNVAMTNTQRNHGMHLHFGNSIIPPSGASEPGEAFSSFVKQFENSDAGNLVLGDVVRIDVGALSSVEKTTTLADTLVVGVVASAGPYANGEQVPVITMGYHKAIKITGSVAAGDYLCASATDGTAEVQSPASTGAFARAVAADVAGFVAAIIFEPELWTPGGAATQILETSGPDILTVGAIVDGEYLKRVGSTIVSDTPAGGGGGGSGLIGDPNTPPASPNAMDDEFDDTSGMSGTVNGLNARWAWRNQSTATLTYPLLGWTSLNPLATGTQYRIIEQTIPSGDWDIGCRIGLGGKVSDDYRGGMVLVKNSNNNLYSFGIRQSGGYVYYIFRETTTGFVSSSFTGAIDYARSGAFLRIAYVSGTTVLSFYVSDDGLTWTRVSAFTDAISVDRIGLGTHQASGQDLVLRCDWFRRFA